MVDKSTPVDKANGNPERMRIVATISPQLSTLYTNLIDKIIWSICFGIVFRESIIIITKSTYLVSNLIQTIF